MKNKMIKGYDIKVIWVVLCFVFVLIFGIILTTKPLYADWEEEVGKKRYQKENGVYATGFTDIDGQRYYFDSDGYLTIGKFYDVDTDAYYYADADGVIQVGVIQEEKHFYITDEMGRLSVGFAQTGGSRYYFDESAELVTGWFTDSGKWYYAAENGVLLTGLLELEGKQYYLQADGVMLANTVVELSGKQYVLREDGSVDEMATAMYPLYSYLNQCRKENGNNELVTDFGVQAVAVQRAETLSAGYQNSGQEDIVLQELLDRHGVSSTGGYELAYGGVPDYSVERLCMDMAKDEALQQILKQDAVTAAGAAFYEQDGMIYYDIILIKKDTSMETNS